MDINASFGNYKKIIWKKIKNCLQIGEKKYVYNGKIPILNPYEVSFHSHNAEPDLESLAKIVRQ